MTNTLARLRVLLNAAPSYMIAAAVILTAIADQLADLIPGDRSTMAVKVITKVVAVLGFATGIVRRVTPVLPADRGLLEPPVKTDPIVVDPPADGGAIGVSEALVIAILAIVLLFIVTRLF